MSNFATRGTGRGKPQNSDHVMNMQQPMQTAFAVPVVQHQSGEFRPEYSMPPAVHAQNFNYRQNYDNSQYYQQQQQPQQFYQRQDYQAYPYYQQPQQYMDQMQYQQQQSAQQAAQPPQPLPQQKRKKAILNIVDPNTLEPVLIASTQEETSAAAPSTETSAPVAAAATVAATAPAPDVVHQNAERKNQVKTDLMEQIKKELSSQSNSESSTTAASVKKVEKTPEPVAIEKPTAVAAAVAPVETAPIVPEIKKPEIVKEDSKDEVEPDDKFDETPAPRDAVSSLSDDAPPEVEKTPEEIAKEEAERVAEEAERKRVREIELDSKIDDLLGSEEVNVDLGVYGRDFMVTLREIEKEYKRTPCPLSPIELNDFGLDINTMSKSEKKTNFTPAWMTKNKTAYRGRTTTDGTGRGGNRQDRGMNNKRPPPVRQSIERVQRMTLPTSKDAWKPDRQKVGAFETTPEEDSVQAICKKVRSLMNKITPTSKENLTKEFKSYDVSSHEQQLAQVVSIIFDKAVEEPKFCSLYAEVCRDQVDHELKLSKGEKKSAFRNAILTRAQATFHDKTYEVTDEKQKALESETDTQKKLALELEILEARTKFRRRKFGNMTFIGHLYRNHLLSTKIVQVCIFELLQTIVPADNIPPKPENIDEESVHCALQLIETLGGIIDTNVGSKMLDQWFEKLEAAKPFCTNKIRFMIMNVVELRKNKWTPRKSVESGPKKLEEIHKDIRQEQIDNEKARDQYENKRGAGIRSNSNSLRGKGGIPSRNSIERKQPDQKRAQAANVSKFTQSQNLPPRNLSLSQCDNLPRPKKDWSSGSVGGGTSESSQQQSQNDNNRKNSIDHRKKSTTNERQAAISAAKNISGSNAGQISARRSTSQNSIAENGAEVVLTEEQQNAREGLMKMIKSDIKEVIEELTTVKDVVDGIFDAVGKEKYASPTLANVYEMIVRSISEEVLNEQQRILLSSILRQSISNKEIKQAFINGVEKFCKHAVDVEMWIDSPKLWNVTGEVLFNISHVLPDVLESEKEMTIERLSLSDLDPVFLAAYAPDESKKFELLVDYLKRWTEAELEENKGNVAEGVSWEYHELKSRGELEKLGLVDELNKCETKTGVSLKQALKL